MNENLLDLSGKIDELTVSIYETIAKVADPAGIKYFIIGASARDMILKHGYGIHTIRATLDIDIGIQVSSWDDYKKLSSDLIEAGKFTKSKEPHRFLFNNTRIDLIRDFFNRCVKIIQAAFLFWLTFTSPTITPLTNLFPA
jgi:predicted nucleotidyltransferase